MPPKKSRKAGGGSRAPTRKAKKSKPAAAKSKAKAKAAANSGSGRQKPLTAYFGKNATVSGAAASGRSGSTSSRYTTGAAGGAGGAAASSSSRQPPRPPAGPQSSSPSDTESETSDSEAEPPAAPASYPGAGVASASSVAAISSRAAVTTGNASNPKPAAGAANVHPQRPMLPPPPAKKSVVKARTAYVYFCKLNKDVLSQRYFEKTGKHPTTELLADALSDRFQRLKPEQRKIYEEHEKIDAIRYKFEKRNFETFSLPTTGGVGSSIFGGSASSSSSNQDATIAAELGSLLRTAAQECPSVVTTAQGLPRDFLDAVRDLDALLTSTAKGLIRKKYGDRGGDGSSTGSSSAWKRILAQWTFPEDAPAVGGGGSSAPRAAGDYRYTMTERLNGEDVFANSGDSKVAQSVEQALFEHHAGDMRGYAIAGRSLLHNLRQNASLRENVIKGEIAGPQLVKMSPRELATEDKKREREELEAQSLKNSIGKAMPKNKWHAREERGGVARIDSSLQSFDASQPLQSFDAAASQLSQQM